MPTIYDVANYCKVSPTTVSLVLNKSTRKVSPATRNRVFEAVRQLNYRPSAVARGLNRKKMNTLGMLVPSSPELHFDGSFFGRLMQAGFHEATDHRQFVTVIPGAYLDDIDQFVGQLTDGRIDGLVVIFPGIDDTFVQRLVESGLPFILAGDRNTSTGVNWVDCDHELGAFLATNHLIDLGHRRIATIAGQFNLDCTIQRLHGYQRALSLAGLSPAPQHVAVETYAFGPGFRVATQWLSGLEAERPTAIVCGDDVIAQGAIEAAIRLGINVPGDVSIVGFDDSDVAEKSNPPLTSVRQPFGEIGRLAISALLSRIDGGGDSTTDKLSPELVVRKSTGPCAQY